MKHLAAIVLFISVVTASAQSWKTDVTPISGTKTDGQADWGVWIIDAATNSYAGAGSFNPFQGSGTVSINTNVSSVTRNSDFYIVVGWSRGGYGHASMVKFKWISAYQIGGNESQSSTSGPFDANGNPTTTGGSPANPVTGTSDPPKSHRATVTLNNSTGTQTARFEIVVTNAANAVIGRLIEDVPAGGTESITLVYNVAFTFSVKKMEKARDGNGIDNYIATGSALSTGTSAESQTDMPKGPTGDSLWGDAPGSGGAISSGTTQAASAAQAAASNVARPGTTEGNADARNQELRNELQRATAQTKASGDQVAGSVNEVGDKLNESLNGIKNALEGMAKAEMGGDLPSVDGPPSENSGFGDFMGDAGDRAASLKGALAGLGAAVGFGGNAGTASLSWTFDFGQIGQTEVTLEPWSSQISMIRQIILWFISMGFVLALVREIRSAFS